jgi:FkbM family methyltransferase
MTHPLSTRVASAIDARANMINDFFGGWQPSDLDLFAKYGFASTPMSGHITDYFGARTPGTCVPWAAGLDGAVIAEPPIPDDGVRAETIEYLALLNSLEGSHDQTFTMIEIGSSYAPWACLAGVLARRGGKRRVNLKSVEASAFFQTLILDNIKANNLDSSSEMTEVVFSAVQGAAGAAEGFTYFPVVSSAMENGGQTSSSDITSDYVGRNVAHEKVQMYTIAKLLDGFEKFDFLHCDIQGSERDVLVPSVALLTQKVRHMFIGTHSRKIEGELIECFHGAGWRLDRERPAMFTHRPDLKDVVGMTTRDGGQYWINPSCD